MQLNIFRIPVQSSSTDLKEYEFEVDDSFFAHFEYGEIEEGSIKAFVGVSYSSRQIQLELKLKGFVEISCDRCLEKYREEVDSNFNLYGKFGHSSGQEEDLDVLWIPEDKNYIDMAPVIFEYLNLSLPLKKVHPSDEDGNSLCDKDMIRKLEELGIIDDEEIE